MDLFNLAARITLDTSEYDEGIKEASEKTSSLGDKLKSGLKTAGRIAAGAVVAGAAAVSAVVKNAVQEYADYEQLIGGVETLFKDSADSVKEYADNAYKTAGLSANQYMETVTSFSASLLQSLGGDTEQAAKIGDMAITDMADNANKMGSSMESIQMAYQGFAKQNYTMLDNLKLGYGGTKTEMERLLADATALSGVDYDIESLSDVYEAIHVIQTDLEITGTTAKEASSTISGSLASVKSSWKNLLVGIADENADFGKLLDNFVDSASTAVENIVPRIIQGLKGVGKLIEGLAPVIAETLPVLIEELLPSLVQAAVSLVASLLQHLPEIIASIINAIPLIIQSIIDGFAPLFESLMSVFTEGWERLKEGAVKKWNEIKESISKKWDEIKQSVSEKAQAVKQSVIDKWEGIKSHLSGALDAIKKFTAEKLGKIKQAYEEHGGGVQGVIAAGWTAIKDAYDTGYGFLDKLTGGRLTKIKETITNAFNNLKNAALNWGKDLLQNFIDGITSKIKALADKVSSVAKTVKNFLGFSEPEEGPLSDFHTYAPDMMKLFAQGITQNAGIVSNALDKALRFDSLNGLDAAAQKPVQPAVGYGGIVINVQNMSVRKDEDIQNIARELYALSQRKSRGRGVLA